MTNFNEQPSEVKIEQYASLRITTKDKAADLSNLAAYGQSAEKIASAEASINEMAQNMKDNLTEDELKAADELYASKAAVESYIDMSVSTQGMTPESMQLPEKNFQELKAKLVDLTELLKDKLSAEELKEADKKIELGLEMMEYQKKKREATQAIHPA